MFFTIFDLVLILILFMFIAFGFALGFIQTIGALLGVVAGAWFAGQLYVPVGGWIAPYVLNNQNLANVLGFIVVFVLVNRLTGFIFYFIDKIFGLISLIPFTKTINRLLGALLGFIEGTLVIGLILFFITRFSFSAWVDGIIASSNVASFFMAISQILTFLLPAWLRTAI